ncbi:WD40-repeat-containing domain protein, partial [Irpex rosettiformis]
MLPRAGQASFNAEDRPQCLKGTREGVLESLRTWALSESGEQFLWLNGPAGTGKSTIAQTFAYLLHSKEKLGASFFCSRNTKERRDLAMIFPTIAFQLATSMNLASQKFRDALLHALQANPDGTSLSLRNQLRDLVLRPAKVSGMKAIIIIDALDECSDDSTTSKLLSLLADVADDIPSLKFFITSRPESNIRSSFHRRELNLRSDQKSLNDVPTTLVDQDIKIFLKGGLSRLAVDRPNLHLPEDWLSEEVIDALTAKAAGLFIFASTVLKFVDDAHYDPRDQLEKLSSNLDDSKIEGSEGLDKLYMDILAHAVPDRDDQFSRRLLTPVLGLLVVARDALSSTVIAALLNFKRDTDVLTVLDSLHSLIIVPENTNEPIRFQHKSFPDFLTDATRCTDSRFRIDRDDHHFSTSCACLVQLPKRLKKNICSVPRYTLNADIEPAKVHEHINEVLRYCCRYWADHLFATDTASAKTRFPMIHHLVLSFLKARQLQWFEVLGLLRELKYGVDSLRGLIDWIPLFNGNYQEILDWATDGYKFILYAFDPITISVAHIYHSALPLLPTSSLLRKQHADDLVGEAKIVLGADESWTKLVRTIQLPDEVLTLEYSPDGAFLAIGGHTFHHVYSTSTGERTFVLNPPSGDETSLQPFFAGSGSWPSERVRSIAFSRDANTIATGSGHEILIWNSKTGAVSKKLSDFPANYTGRVDSWEQIITVEFHPTLHHLLLSRTRTGRICLWDINTDTNHPICTQKKAGDLCWLKKHNEKRVIICLERTGHTELWDVEPARVVRTFEPRASSSTNDRATAMVASSEDGSLVASALGQSFVVYDAQTGDCVRHIHLDIGGHFINSLQFTPTGVAIAISDTRFVHSTIRMIHLDSRIGDDMLYDRDGPPIVCLALSPDGRTIAFGGVHDYLQANTVRIWDASAVRKVEPQGNETEEQGIGSIGSLHFSIDGKLLCASEEHNIVKVWDTHDGALRSVLRTTSLSPTGDTYSVNNTIILKDNIHAVTHEKCGKSDVLRLW